MIKVQVEGQTTLLKKRSCPGIGKIDTVEKQSQGLPHQEKIPYQYEKFASIRFPPKTYSDFLVLHRIYHGRLNMALRGYPEQILYLGENTRNLRFIEFGLFYDVDDSVVAHMVQ